MVDWKEIIKDTKVSFGGLKITARCPTDSTYVSMCMPNCIDVETGKPILQNYTFPLLNTDNEEEAREYIIWHFKNFILHEFQESVVISGKKLPDNGHITKTTIKNSLPVPNETWSARQLAK